MFFPSPSTWNMAKETPQPYYGEYDLLESFIMRNTQGHNIHILPAVLITQITVRPSS